MTHQKTTGVLLTATAAAMFSVVNVTHAAENATSTDQVKCSGVNACKGMSECATARSVCSPPAI